MLDPDSGGGAAGGIIMGGIKTGDEAGAAGGASISTTGSGIFGGALETSLSRFSMF